jgi:hypothetical protein
MNLCFTLEQLVFSMAVAPTRAKTLVATQIPGGNRRLAS